jgi:signal transduction histidine kinase
MVFEQYTTDSSQPSRENLVPLQWVVVIGTSYLSLFSNGTVADDTRVYLLIGALLGSIIVLQRAPAGFLASRFFPYGLLLVDTTFISFGIALSQEASWDFFLLFFVCLFITAIGESMIQAVIGCVIICVAAVMFTVSQNVNQLKIDSALLVRIPFMFGVSVLFGYLAEQVKGEKRKKAELERTLQGQLIMKDQFFSHVSHELRSPMAAIHQFVTILGDGLAGDLNSEQREYLTIILRNVKQLQNMISDLLEATRANTNKLAIDPRCVPISDLIADVLETTLPTIAGKEVTLSADVPNDLPLVYADPERVRQIFTNLIGNAVKFTPEKGKITVRAEIYEKDRDFIRAAVADSGYGISPEATKRIFDRLYQETKNHGGNRHGLGLGLYICKELVALHGGQIWVESELGKGSIFYFTLPIYSLSKTIYPVITENGRLKDHIALIKVGLFPVNGSSSRHLTEALTKETWTILKNYDLPNRRIVLPRTFHSAGYEVFHVVECSDQPGVESAAQRIQHELRQYEELRDSRIGLTVSCASVNGPRRLSDTPLEQLTDDVATAIRDLQRMPMPEQINNGNHADSAEMSHGVRTPLTVVLGYSAMLRDKLLGDLNPAQENALDKVIGHTNDLLTTIENILEAWKIENDGVQVAHEQVNVIEFLSELKASYECSRTKVLSILWDHPSEFPTITTDVVKLSLILRNLVNNAIKFTDQGGVLITVRYNADSRTAEFKVVDSGTGIPKQAIPKLFDKFCQLKLAQRNSMSGIGLGLYIVKTLTSLMGGRVEVESDLNQGSIFKVTLPAYRVVTEGVNQCSKFKSTTWPAVSRLSESE